HISEVSLSFHLSTSATMQPRVPTCSSCKKPTTRFLFPYFSPMLEEITSVLLYIRKHLSLVFSGAYILYSGTLDTFLDPDNNNNNSSVNNLTYDQALQHAAN
ncbi:768_t:CDS:2, partial [Dentiscutata heterogama]